MNIVDILILIFLGFGALIGFKRGFTRQLVSFLGIFVILILSFVLKNPISVFMYNNLPFFNFGGIFKDITILNILVYEVISFFIVFFLLSIVFRFILFLTKGFEKILTFTIILGIPSKILGAILGVLQHVVYVFIVMYILSLPTFNIGIVKEAKIGNGILHNTPILTSVCDKTLNIFNDIVILSEEYNNTNNMDEFNQKVVDKMLENKIITEENLQILIDKGKITLD